LGRENSLAKDLVDLVLLIEQAKMDAARVAKAISDTFQRRKTHNLPTVLVLPPEGRGRFRKWRRNVASIQT